MSPTRSALALSRAWRGRAGTPPDLPLWEYGIGAKWLELLKEIAPGVTRVAVLRDLTLGLSQLGAIQAVGPSFGVEIRAVGVRVAGEIERDVAAFARYSNGGLIVTASTSAAVHRNLITKLAAAPIAPVYSFRYFVTVGGLISYGANSIDQFRRAAGYSYSFRLRAHCVHHRLRHLVRHRWRRDRSCSRLQRERHHAPIHRIPYHGKRPRLVLGSHQ